MMVLGEIDAYILKELLKDGRKSFTKIAKEYNTSTDVIWKHFKEMEKSGIIAGATIQYNYPLFSYEGVATLLVNVESEHINEVLERLTKNPDIHASRIYNSVYNIGLVTTFKSLKEIESVKERFTRQNSVIESRIYLWTDVINIPENLSFGFPHVVCKKNSDDKPKKTAQNSKVKLDSTDMQIVDELSNDGRVPFSRIAQLLGVSTDTVSRRYKALVEKGFVKVCIRFNPMLLGYTGLLNVYISVTSESKNFAIETISKIPDVNYLVKISGDFDLHVAVLIREIQDIYDFNEKITQIPGIRKIEADIKKLPPRWPGLRQYITTF
jgi:Lrp/AsnC family transcriptional regulator for asnA, asnC and gidA